MIWLYTFLGLVVFVGLFFVFVKIVLIAAEEGELPDND